MDDEYERRYCKRCMIFTHVDDNGNCELCAEYDALRKEVEELKALKCSKSEYDLRIQAEDLAVLSELLRKEVEKLKAKIRVFRVPDELVELIQRVYAAPIGPDKIEASELFGQGSGYWVESLLQAQGIIADQSGGE